MKNNTYFMKITKEEIINIIDERIKTEYSKHNKLDWSKIAAHKIYATIIDIFRVCNIDDLDVPISTSDIDNLIKFHEKINQQKDCPPEFLEIVNKEFWNLIWK